MELIACDIKKLKPTKYPKNGKKLYRGFFLRKMKVFTHIYNIEENLYIASIINNQTDVVEWIDKRYDEIIRRINDTKRS